MAAVDFNQLFEQFSSIRVGVIGDVMLDTYMWGRVDRISPEAPVPVVALQKKDYRIGGAGNVALNLASLGAKVSILSVCGNDEEGGQLRKMFSGNAIGTEFLLESDKRITTNKIRVISRNQQMMRLDSEVTSDLGYEDENRLLLAIQAYIAQEKPGVIIFEDYNKGVLTENLISKAIALCRTKDIITTVDPKRKNFFSYRGVDIFKPNLKEVREGLNLLDQAVDLEHMGRIDASLREQLQHRISFITLSEKGVYYAGVGNARIIPSHLRNIADVSGAGDTVIAVASLVYAATRDMDLAAETANIAGGLVCEEVGTMAIDKGRLLRECRELLGSEK
jgi:D-glycero-beta-D-manno-heptose-7-phosphate kinase